MANLRGKKITQKGERENNLKNVYGVLHDREKVHVGVNHCVGDISVDEYGA